MRNHNMQTSHKSKCKATLRQGNTMNKQRTKQGFTLIELLVVIAIIAILAAILFPVFGRARENARRSSCQSNLKQIGLSLAQYTQDYDERLVPAGGDSGSPSWDTRIAPYMGQSAAVGGASGLLQCPSDTVTRLFEDTSRRSYSLNGSWDSKAGFGGGTQPWSRDTRLPRQPLAGITSSAELIVLTEAPGGANVVGNQNRTVVMSPFGNDDPSSTSCNFWEAQNCTWTSDTSGRLTQMHFDGYNYLFADGHVKFLRPLRTIGIGNPSWPRGLWTTEEND